MECVQNCRNGCYSRMCRNIDSNMQSFRCCGKNFRSIDTFAAAVIRLVWQQSRETGKDRNANAMNMQRGKLLLLQNRKG